MEPEDIDVWERRLEAETLLLTVKRDEAEAELQRVLKKIDLLRQMRSLDQVPVPSLPTRPVVMESRATPISVRENVRKVLTDSSRPMHIGEIHQYFLAHGYSIPGIGTPFNILAHIVNDKSFVRVARGTYALAGTVDPDQIIPKSARRQKKLNTKLKKRIPTGG